MLESGSEATEERKRKWKLIYGPGLSKYNYPKTLACIREEARTRMCSDEENDDHVQMKSEIN